MKIILSRKGFDDSNGGCASPVFPDGTMLSMPIPSEGETVSYKDLIYNEISYLELLNQLNPKYKYGTCHLDPDLRSDIRKESNSAWIPAFGQISSSSSYLHNSNVEVGDLFLFFGWYHKVIEENGQYRYTLKSDINGKDIKDYFDYNDFHAIWGYMQIGEIITDKEKIKEFYWHPHSHESRLADKTNTLYIPTERLSFNQALPGFGTLDYRDDRVLTMKGKSRGNWKIQEPYMPENVCGNRKNSSKYQDCVYYQGVWQELVLKESNVTEEWVKSIIE